MTIKPHHWVRNAYYVNHDGAAWLLAYDPIICYWCVYGGGALVAKAKDKWQALERLATLTQHPWSY